MDREKSGEGKSIRSELLEEIRTGNYAGVRKLPSEDILAEQLHISRTQLRDVLGGLEAEGYVSRRRGVGTIINRHVLQETSRIDLGTEFLEMVRQSGATAEVLSTKIVQEFCNPEIAAILNIREGSPIYRICRLVAANGRKAIYGEDCFSFNLICDNSYTQKDLEKPVFDFLKEFCGREVHMNLAKLRPLVADEKLAQTFDLPQGSPLLRISEIGYDFEGNPLLWSVEDYADNVVEHTVLRKWL